MKTIINYFNTFKRIKEFEQEVIRLNLIINEKNETIDKAAIVITTYEKENEKMRLEIIQNKVQVSLSTLKLDK